jgi:DNA-binding NtrC family response regulator
MTDTTPPGDHRGSETVLVVEDEDALRAVTARILTRAGYQVLTAENGPAALAVTRSHLGPIDLLLTDVIMPGMLGPDLAHAVQAERPDVRVLCMSGYAHTALAGEGDMPLLDKPFAGEDLLARVREVLDS